MITFLKKIFGLNKTDEREVSVSGASAQQQVVATQTESVPMRQEPPLAETTSALAPVSVEVSSPAVEEKSTPVVITPKKRAKKPAKTATPKVDNTVVMPKRSRTKKSNDVQQDGIPIVETSGTWPFPPPEEGAAKTATKTKKSKK